MPPSPPDALSLLLRTALEHQASDIHLAQGQPVVFRILGRLQVWAEAPSPWTGTALTETLAEQTLAQLPSLDDGTLAHPEHGRWRLHRYAKVSGCAAALRHIAPQAPRLAEVAVLPRDADTLASLACLSRGLVLCTGPTGAGKSSTLAALIAHRLAHCRDHVLTLEDPIEILHTTTQGLISQREVGTHCSDFSSGLKAALRADPDCILLGELRDADTIRLALTAAETGHLVLSTLHTPGAGEAVHRLLDAFTGAEREAVRGQLADTLQAVIAQRLCRHRQGASRVAALEILRVTPAARHLIREHKIAQLQSVMQSGAALGMHTLDQHLQQLQNAGFVSAEDARVHARNPETWT